NEIDEMTNRGVEITPKNLCVSYKTHVVMPWHKMEDGLREQAAGANGIGTTRRGIGPCYADKMYRTTAIRVCDLLHPDSLQEKVERIASTRRKVFAALYDDPPALD